MRRVVVAVAMLAGVAGCGGVRPAAHLTPAEKRACTVRVYFKSGASRSQERFVGSKLRGDARVKHVTFISKAQALAEMKKKYPKVIGAQLLPVNPLPDAFTATPAIPTDTAAIGVAVKHAHWPGVGDVRWGTLLHRSVCGGASP
jgi:cell division protein FtsX